MLGLRNYWKHRGALLADYHVVRCRKLKLQDLYIGNSSSIYWYSHGFNWRGPVVFVLGMWPFLRKLAFKPIIHIRISKKSQWTDSLFELCSRTHWLRWCTYLLIHRRMGQVVQFDVPRWRGNQLYCYVSIGSPLSTPRTRVGWAVYRHAGRWGELPTEPHGGRWASGGEDGEWSSLSVVISSLLGGLSIFDDVANHALSW